MTRTRTVIVLVAASFLLPVTTAWADADDEKRTDYLPPRELPKSVTDILNNAIKENSKSLEDLHKEFIKRKKAPSTWLTQASALRTNWNQHIAAANAQLSKVRPGKPAGTLKRGRLQPWADKYDRFFRVAVITPGGYAVSWKYNVDQMIAHWKGMQNNQPSIQRKLVEEAKLIQGRFIFVERYVNESARSRSPSGMLEYARKKAEARALLTMTRNLMKTIQNKQTRLKKLFKDEDPEKYAKSVGVLVKKSWTDSALNEHAVPPDWIETVEDWWVVLQKRYDEYKKEYDKAKVVCGPVLKATLFEQVPVFKGKYLNNLDARIIEVKNALEKME